MSYRMAPISMTLSDLECHCSRLNFSNSYLSMNMTCITYAACVYMDGKVSTVFNRNCFYRAMLSILGTSHGPVSVRLSVTSRCSIETDERIELVFGM